MRTAVASTIILMMALCAPMAQAQTNASQSRASYDVQYLRRAAVESLLEINLGLIAQTNSQNSAVQALGTHLVEGHTAALEAAESVAEQLGVSLPGLTEQQIAALQRYAAMSTRQFERQFIAYNIRTHSQAIQRATSAALRARHPMVRGYARDQLPVLLEHYLSTLDVRERLLGS